MGSVLYRCLTGNPPFNMGGYEAIGAAAFRRPVRRETCALFGLPDRAVLTLAMAPKPEDRPSTSAELRSMFFSAVEGTRTLSCESAKFHGGIVQKTARKI